MKCTECSASLAAPDPVPGVGKELLLLVCVSTAAANARRRRALRKTWFSFKTQPGPWLTCEQQNSVKLLFVASRNTDQAAALAAEQAQHGDMLLVDTPEGYGHLWRKALTSLAELQQQGLHFVYYMHADDDSYVRLDLLLPLLEKSPRQHFYWGYIWDGSAGRVTAPIRDPRNKSHMPEEQYPLDWYPPFASGCGFVLSHDLVAALLQQPLPDYRLLDPPFGIHLTSRDTGRCVLPDRPVLPTHDDRVRPYRALPVYHPDTIVQHYLTPEEMAPFHEQALASAGHGRGAGGASSSSNTVGDAAGPAEHLYAQLVAMGLLRR